MKPTDQHKLEFVIASLQNDKASGIDDLNNTPLKEIKDIVVLPLSTIFN